MKIIQALLVSFVFTFALANDDVVHLVGPGDSAYEKLSSLKMQNKLVASAEKYKKYGFVDRATHHDMAFPIDVNEYSSMNGFGVMWVTSHTHVKEELPLKNLRIYMEKFGTIGLEPMYVFSSEEANDLVSKVLGKYRNDSIFMVPFFEETKGATLVADYSINRNDFVLGKIVNEFPFLIENPKKLTKDVAYPDMENFHNMLKREYPISQDLIE
ncbi:MAG: hypothetical protein GY750_03320 [Lentisphaerae bacterium]|nr:hypothetical protein [Lentisphaerota bacterium]